MAFPARLTTVRLLVAVAMVAGTAALRSQAFALHKAHPTPCARRRRLPTSSLSASASDSDSFTVQERALLGALALAGSTETALLTASKVTGAPVAAALGGLCTSPAACGDVLNGPYAAVPFLNVPLSAVGFVMYTSVALLCVAPALGNVLARGRNDDSNARALILLFTSAMATFSAYLMAVLGLQVYGRYSP